MTKGRRHDNSQDGYKGDWAAGSRGGIGGGGVIHDDDLLPDPRVAERYGVSTRTIPRWDANPELGFPEAIVINGRRYRRRSELEAFERAHVSKGRPSARKQQTLSPRNKKTQEHI
jgi:hypothetical protein